MTKIMIGLPSKGEIKTDMALCLSHLAASIKKKYGDFEATRAFAAVDDARNLIVDEFIKSDCTHLLFVDWDATFPEDAAEMLLEADKDIIGVNAAKHVTGNPVVTHDINGNEINYVYHKTQRVPAIGMHLTLIKRKVFETMPWPWFHRYIIADQRKMATEDFTFCKNADQNYGFEVWVHNHLSAACGHIDNGQGVKTLEPIINRQIKEANQTLMKRKITELRKQAEDFKNQEPTGLNIPYKPEWCD